jgi:hypothetical protein
MACAPRDTSSRRPSSSAPSRSCSPDATSSAAPRPAPARPPRSPCPFFRNSASIAPGPRALILEPTRELAAQVETAVPRLRALHRFENHRRLWRRRLRTATTLCARVRTSSSPRPGRLLDHLEQGTVRLDKVQFLVLDEADRMLDMGFLPDVRRILEKCPRQRHTALFSATIPPQIETLINGRCTIPETIEIGARRTPAETVKHVIYPVSDSQKSDLLLELLEARELQLGAGLLPDEARRRPHRRIAQAQQPRRGRAAFQPHAARTRAGAEGFPRRHDSKRSWPRTSPRADSTSRT